MTHKISDINEETRTGFCSEHNEIVSLYPTEGRWRCKPALQAYQKERHKTRPKRAWDSEKGLDARLRRFYKISLKGWLEKFENQGNKCAICGATESEPTWATDHDRSCCSGRISCGNCLRGILCLTCNVGLGMFKDSPDKLTAAIKYLQDHAR